MKPKVAAGGAAGAFTVIVVYVASLFGLEIPGEVGAAIAVVISTTAAWLKKEAA